MNPDKLPATVDYYNRVEVVQHFRDLLNFSTLLEKGLDAEVDDFRALLKSHGWDEKNIREAYEEAAKYTIWENRIPPIIKNG